MPVSEATYRAVVEEATEAQWELWDGRLREKPRMGAEHNDVMARLAMTIGGQLDWRTHRLRINSSHVKRTVRNYFIPDVRVLPAAWFHEQTGQPGHLEVYEGPWPLIVEIWSQSTGDYDVDDKLPEYQERGDREIWRLHPFDRTLIAWRRLPNGEYEPEMFSGGVVRPVALPGVRIDLDQLFDFS